MGGTRRADGITSTSTSRSRRIYRCWSQAPQNAPHSAYKGMAAGEERPYLWLMVRVKGEEAAAGACVGVGWEDKRDNEHQATVLCGAFENKH